MAPFAADDDPHPGRPCRQVQEAGELGDIAALADTAVGIEAGVHTFFGIRSMAGAKVL